jgi:hypothetical protein
MEWGRSSKKLFHTIFRLLWYHLEIHLSSVSFALHPCRPRSQNQNHMSQMHPPLFSEWMKFVISYENRLARSELTKLLGDRNFHIFTGDLPSPLVLSL